MKVSRISENKCLFLAFLFVAVLLLNVWIGAGFAKEGVIDISTLARDTQKTTKSTDEVTLVWWIPEEFWVASLSQNPAVTETQIENFLNILRPYTVVVAVDGKMGFFGGIAYRPEAEIRLNIQLIDKKGEIYHPLAEDAISIDCRSLLASMKPSLVDILGPTGENMYFFLFPANDKMGQRIADAKVEGSFIIKMDDREFKWKLPLGSLLPPKICSRCKEKCSGAWKYCPWCGAKLPK